jgi:hypothetical protein
MKNRMKYLLTIFSQNVINILKTKFFRVFYLVSLSFTQDDVHVVPNYAVLDIMNLPSWTIEIFFNRKTVIYKKKNVVLKFFPILI